MRTIILFFAMISMIAGANAQAAKKSNPTKKPATKVAAPKSTSASKAETKIEAPKVAATPGANITFQTEDIDYGTIAKGSEPKRQFIITNNGTEPLTITGCSGSCGCTVPTCPKEPIMPGKTSTIDVNYDTQRGGAFTKMVTIMSNAVNEPNKVVKIHGTVTE
jgi:hypothetical protein